MTQSDWTSALNLQNPAKALEDISAYGRELFRPTLRLGVTGLARSGKTVFITSLIHNLIHSGRLPFVSAIADGRVERIYLEPQPDDNIPRFDYETHLKALTDDDPFWPESTRQVSQLRLTIDYRPAGFVKRNLGINRLSIDIVDYPGEWILDLPLLSMSYDEWSEASLKIAQEAERKEFAADWLSYLRDVDADSADDEGKALKATKLFTAYLKKCRADDVSFSTVPPGRFLMPGELEGSPALTFSPLFSQAEAGASETLRSMMSRRFEAYKTYVVKPFFRNHFARLDRQIVLVDAMQALNAGPAAVQDLERALSDILMCFRPGANSWLSTILGKRIDRILFAATKADHLHHRSHDRLEAILAALTRSAIERASFAGAEVKTLAMAALRATREGEVTQGAEVLPCIMGHPLAGETIGGQHYDGSTEIVVFPGDLPDDPQQALLGGASASSGRDEDMRFIRFRPPLIETGFGGAAAAALPHIRLDRAIEFLIGDKLA